MRRTHTIPGCELLMWCTGSRVPVLDAWIRVVHDATHHHSAERGSVAGAWVREGTACGRLIRATHGYECVGRGVPRECAAAVVVRMGSAVERVPMM